MDGIPIKADLQPPPSVFTPLSEISTGPDFAESFQGLPNNLNQDDKNDIIMSSLDRKKEQQLLQEFSKSALTKSFRFRAFNGCLILFPLVQDANLFDQILVSKASNPFLTAVDSIRLHMDKSHSAALVKIIYGLQFDACLSYYHDQSSSSKEVLMRYNHLHTLVKSNLILVSSISEFDSNIRVVRVVAPFECLVGEAERIGMKYPLTREAINRLLPHTKHTEQNNFSLLSKCKALFDCSKIDKASTVFSIERFHDFEKSRSGDYRLDFFTPFNRNTLLYSIALRCANQFVVSDRDSIMEMIDLKIYNDFFCFHDSSFGERVSIRSELLSWAESPNIFSKIPLEKIRNYYGEEFALNFARTRFFIVWIIPLAFAYGIINCINNSNSLRALFDNAATPAFGIILNLWSILFFKFWKRYTNNLIFLWDLDSINDVEYVRSDWKSSKIGQSRITGKQVRFETATNNIFKLCVSNLLLGFFVIFLLGLLAVTIFWQSLFKDYYQSTVGGSAAGAALELFQIILFSAISVRVAEHLTVFENHKYSKQHSHHFIWKLLCLTFFSVFGMLFFVGIIKPLISAFFIESQTEFLYFGRFEVTCGVSGSKYTCFEDLAISAIVIIAGRHLFMLLYEIYNFVRTRFLLEKNEKQSWPKESELRNISVSCLDFKLAYFAIQFGEVLFFSVSFAVGPVLILLTNLVSVRSTLSNYLMNYKIPFLKGISNIKTWEKIISYYVHLGFFTNAFILSFTSTGLNEWELYLFQKTEVSSLISIYFLLLIKVLCVLFYQNTMLIIFSATESFISDVPSTAQLGRRAEKQIKKVIDRNYYAESEIDLNSEVSYLLC